jgi:HD-GYP domain-containing protein (c-di-GMP phosphodiesterase class II)
MGYLLCFSLLLFQTISYGQTISNVTASREADKVVIRYDLTGEKESSYSIKLSYATDQKSYDRTPRLLAGDIGDGQQVGIGKSITWEAKKELGSFQGSLTFKVEIVSKSIAKTAIDSLTVEDDFVRIRFVSMEKLLDGFKIKVAMQAKQDFKSNLNTLSYAMDNINKIYKLDMATCNSVDIIKNKYEFNSRIEEYVELTFVNKFVNERGTSIKGFQINYSKGVVILNF